MMQKIYSGPDSTQVYAPPPAAYDPGYEHSHSKTEPLVVSGDGCDDQASWTSKHGEDAPWRRTFRAFDVVSDVSSIVIPLSLLGFLAAVLRLDGSSASEQEFRQWHNATGVFATIFPMLFASIIGRLMYEIARWKLEQGTTMGSLEQVLGSRTFGGTLLTQFHMRAINVLGLILLLIWVFSPLGAQSILRILELHYEPNILPVTVSAQGTAKNMRLSDYVVQDSGSAALTDVYSGYLGNLFNTLLLAPTDMQTDPMDLWGNVKIPFLPEEHDSINEEWREVPRTADHEHFSSLAGVAIATDPVGASPFEIESAYADLHCFNVSTSSTERMPEHGEIVDVEWGWGSIGDIYPPVPPRIGNGSWSGFSRVRNNSVSTIRDPMWSIALDRFVDAYWLNRTEQIIRRGGVLGSYPPFEDQILDESSQSPILLVNETGIEAGPTEILFQGIHQPRLRHAVVDITARCNVRQRYVQSRVECTRANPIARQNCTVVAQRPSRQVHPTENLSHLSFPRVFFHISKELPMATFIPMVGVDLAISYLNNPANMTVFDLAQEAFADIDKDKFSRRLSQLINTYILVGNRDDPIRRSDGPYRIPWMEVNGKVTKDVPIYRVSTSWIALGFASSGVLLLGGILSVVLTHMAMGPDVLGFASTVVRDSKFIDVPRDVGGMDGVEVSRMMKSQRVRYGYSELTLEGRPLLGVGMENETRSIK